MSATALHVRAGDEGYVLTVDGPLDLSTSDELALTIRILAVDLRPAGLLIDLRDAPEVGGEAAMTVRLACAEARSCGVPVQVLPSTGGPPGAAWIS